MSDRDMRKVVSPIASSRTHHGFNEAILSHVVNETEKHGIDICLRVLLR